MKCRIQKPIDIPKPTEIVVDIVTGKRVLKGKWTSEKNEEMEHYVHAELSKEIHIKMLKELLRDL
jgi:hypothetical protein